MNWDESGIQKKFKKCGRLLFRYTFSASSHIVGHCRRVLDSGPVQAERLHFSGRKAWSNKSDSGSYPDKQGIRVHMSAASARLKTGNACMNAVNLKRLARTDGWDFRTDVAQIFSGYCICRVRGAVSIGRNGLRNLKICDSYANICRDSMNNSCCPHNSKLDYRNIHNDKCY